MHQFPQSEVFLEIYGPQLAAFSRALPMPGTSPLRAHSPVPIVTPRTPGATHGGHKPFPTLALLAGHQLGSLAAQPSDAQPALLIYLFHDLCPRKSIPPAPESLPALLLFH